MEKSYEFKASNPDLAIKKGLEELGLKEEEADIEILSQGGIFSKACVRITPKEQVGTQTEEESTDSEFEPESESIENNAFEEVVEEVPEKQETPEEREARLAVMKQMAADGKEFLETLAEHMSVGVTVEAKVKEEEVCLYIGGEDAKAFIGRKGEVLDAVQTLVNQIVFKEGANGTRVIVDADFYRERRKKALVQLAKRLAQTAYDKHREISLEPMNSYERRIIHAALTNSTEATTRSDGEGKDRHVVIVPTNGTMSYGNASSEFRRRGPIKTKSFGYSKRKF